MFEVEEELVIFLIEIGTTLGGGTASIVCTVEEEPNEACAYPIISMKIKLNKG